jgi:hypothetical protein
MAYVRGPILYAHHLPKAGREKQKQRTDREILEEVLELLRNQERKANCTRWAHSIFVGRRFKRTGYCYGGIEAEH